MNQNIFWIAIEGCDGAGKTSLLSFLSNYYKGCNDVIFVKNATNITLDNCISQFRRSESYNPHIHMYLETLSTYITLVDTLDKIKNMPEHITRIIILDRYWYSLLVYTRVLSSQDADWGVMKILPKPNWVVYLRCEPTILYMRKKELEPIESGHKMDNLFSDFCEFQSKIDCEYRLTLSLANQKYTEIRTDTHPTEKIALDIIKEIEQIRRLNEQ